MKVRTYWQIVVFFIFIAGMVENVMAVLEKTSLDTIHLEDGTVLFGKIVSQSSRIVCVQIDGSTETFPTDRIVKIEYAAGGATEHPEDRSKVIGRLDTIHLEDGTILFGKIVSQSSRIVCVQIDGSTETFPTNRIAKIEYAPRGATIHLKDGSKVIGCFILQDSKFLMLATKEKRLKVPIDEIDYIEFVVPIEVKNIMREMAKTGFLQDYSLILLVWNCFLYGSLLFLVSSQ